jgi:arylsulfatase A-like enzyme
MNEEVMTAKRKNVIWIFGDQHRGQALSCRGDINVNTPNLDRMAIDGQLYPNAVAGFPLCCPFRGSLITSKYPHQCVPGHEYPLPRDLQTIAHAFKDNGYETTWLGKWHLGGWHEWKGRAAFYTILKEDRGGFDTWIGYENNNAQYDCWVHGHNNKGEEIERYRLPGYETDCLTDMLIDNLKEYGAKRKDGDDTPFFTSLSVQPPHDPYVAPAEYMGRHNPASLTMRPNVPNVDRVQQRARQELAGAYAMIENIDYNIGRILETLQNEGLADDTYIIYFSDHGDMHGSHGQFRKMTAYEESIRIPFIIYGGESRYNCRHYQPDAPINHVDIAPTTLGICGIEKPDWMDGFDYSSLFLPGKTVENIPDSAYIQSVIPTGHGDSVDRPWRGIVTNDGWKYVCLEHQPWLMFNLNEDPYEQVNMALNTGFNNKRKELHEKLKEWINNTDDTFILPEL